MITNLILGASGQDGSYLTELLCAREQTVYAALRGGADHAKAEWLQSLAPQAAIIAADLLDEGSLRRAIELAQPDRIFNLAAVSSPTLAWSHPLLAGEVTGLGVTRLLDAVRAVKSDAKVVQAGSLAEHGPYGAAKLYARAICADYRARGTAVYTAILGGHHSPRRGRSYFSHKVTRAAAEIALGRRPYLRLGRLDGRRDWGWAQDFVQALALLPEIDPDEYVISTGQPHSSREWLDAVFGYLDLQWPEHVMTDPEAGNPIEQDQTAPSDPRLAQWWIPRQEFAGLAETMVDADVAELRGDG